MSVDATVIIQVGNGLRDDDSEVDYVDQVDADDFEYSEDGGDVDEFEEVTSPE